MGTDNIGDELKVSQQFKSNDDMKGLPVAGYKPTQSMEAIHAVNVFKELEERTLRHVETLLDGTMGIDARMMAVGRTQLQLAFMALNRAIFQPGRVKLPEDSEMTIFETAKAAREVK